MEIADQFKEKANKDSRNLPKGRKGTFFLNACEKAY